jgi:hypothetical protein
VQATAGKPFSGRIERQAVGAGAVNPFEIDIRSLSPVRCTGCQQTDKKIHR